MWEKIKNFFRFLDLNSDNKINQPDDSFAKLKIKDANAFINDQITDSVTPVKTRVSRVKEQEVVDVVNPTKSKKRVSKKKTTNK